MGMHPIPLGQVVVEDGFWSPRQQLMTRVTIPCMEQILHDQAPGEVRSHAVSNFRMAAGEETGQFQGMVFQDSDVAKWLEAAAYSLNLESDPTLEKRVDDMVALIGRCQQPDGYLNTYFTIKEPENRWANLLECHELYCAGHMMEAGAALYETTGKDELLKICIRLADHICARFGEGGQEGIPGHQEIEIGLMRLYQATGQEKYLHMALRFLDLRGQDPNWFARHTPAHPGVTYGGYPIEPGDAPYNQSDVPVRRQTAARGHAVRQLYMLTAMAQTAAHTGDREMAQACRRLFSNITQRQMYLTGAVGSSAHQESFSVDYDLPADRCYGETCASVAMAFFAHSMLGLEADGRYADILELELFNGALAGMQLDGTRFFYVNPLSMDPALAGRVPGYQHVLPQRPQWHACACCPPNLARLIASLGKYLWGQEKDALYSHLFIGSRVKTSLAALRLETGYPWEGRALYTLENCRREPFALAVHIPGYLGGFRLFINGRETQTPLRQGYLYIDRAWRAGDRVEILFDLPVRRIYAHPNLRDAAGKVALARGPIIYCLEQADNPPPLWSLSLPADSPVTPLPYDENLLGGVICLEARGLHTTWAQDSLYLCRAPASSPCVLRAIPYYAWANRDVGQMTVWLRES